LPPGPCARDPRGMASDPTAAPTRVLVADDSPQVRAGLARLLEVHADLVLVGTAADGREAQTRAAALRPDVVVMDLSMPELDGVEATRELVRALPETRVVVLTATGDRAQLRRALEAGAVSVVLKDAHPGELLAQIRRAAADCGRGRRPGPGRGR
jgi:DNA-binding NarL/FixJ family response regulator